MSSHVHPRSTYVGILSVERRAPSVERRASSVERRAPSAERRVLALLCTTLGVILLVAAALKGHSLLVDFVPGKTIFTSRPVQFLAVEVELALGLWLVSGIGLTWAARVAMACFLVLAASSGWLLASGAECCGCPGRLSVSPWFTFLFNLAALGSLSLAPRPDEGSKTAFPAPKAISSANCSNPSNTASARSDEAYRPSSGLNLEGRWPIRIR